MSVEPRDLRSTRTTCPYCGVGCGVVATPDGRGGAAIAGDPDHPANFGRLCSKGSALGETLSLDGRLLHPEIGGVRVTWDGALDHVAAGITRVAAEHGPGAVAFYLSGQLLTEDYYVANKLAKGFIGTGHVDTNSRLCMASSVAGHRRVFGTDTVPGSYEDLDEADLIVLVGSNTAWCHPVLFQRMQAARARRGTVLVSIDPRRNATADECDLHLPIAPGTDTVLFAGLLVHLHAAGAVDCGYVDRHTTGFEAALECAGEIAPDLEGVCRHTGLPRADVERFYALFTRTERVVTCYSQGVNQSAQGTDKVAAILACHLATGRIGRPGLGPFSLTGQPNAMGGREVGGLANMLAAHMNYTPVEIDRVARFWGAARMATAEGAKAVQLFDAIDRGEIRALWVMATNPAVSLPEADRVRRALGKLDLLVVSENVRRNDTVLAGAHVLLPAAAWAEKDGTVTNSERRISRQRAFLPLPEEAKPDWWIMSEVARRMGFGAAFAYPNAGAIHREHAALSAFENGGARDFDIGALADLDDAGYDALAPFQWPRPAGARTGTARLFAEGGYYTPDRRAVFRPPQRPELAAALSDAFPLRLNTGRVRDQWHTMTRTGKSPRLGGHLPVPFVAIHPSDADRLGVTDGGLARVGSPYGSAVLEARIDAGQRPGEIFVPIHWTAETSSDGRTGALVQGHTDPFSGQPEMKATPAALAPVVAAYRGFVVARGAVDLPQGTWWARVALDEANGLLFATDILPGEIASALVAAHPGLEIAEYADPAAGIHRVALFRQGRLEAALFVGPAALRPHWDAVKLMFATPSLDAAARRLLLSGRAAGGIADPGPVVCACFGVGLTAIRAALASGAAGSVAEIGAALRAGTNCGSCIPELKKLVGGRDVARTAAG